MKMRNRVTVKVEFAQKVKQFVNDMNEFECDIDIVSGRLVLDAKSVLAIFSLDLSKSFDVVIHTDDEEILKQFNNIMIRYEVIE